jgi:exodeoxyribonuclease-3
VLAGDFNVIPAPPTSTIRPPGSTTRCSAATRESFQSLLGLGLTDALRAVTDEPGQYTFWDYQAGAWQKNWGLRIDHLLLSPQASDRLTDVGIDSYVRAWEKPSDHVPVWADLDLETAPRGDELCVADHHDDPTILNAWLSNKKPAIG